MIDASLRARVCGEVQDFGLAKLREPPVSGNSDTSSPTGDFEGVVRVGSLDGESHHLSGHEGAVD